MRGLHKELPQTTKRLCSTSRATLSLQPSKSTEHSGRFAAENPVLDGQEDSKVLPWEAVCGAESRHTEVKEP